MSTKNLYFLVATILCLGVVKLFVYSTQLSTEDKAFQEQFSMKYAVFSIVKPAELNFASEEVPIHSPEVWERIDKELLKNIYWQSNTMLYFKRANKYFPIIEPILKQYNIPDDFKYLAVIESGLDNVVSPSGAAGFWQIMKTTGREYGLEVNKHIDERYNLEKATIVACKYLQDSYNIFGNWTMSAAAYNMGKSGASRRMKEQITNNYYNLYLNSETARYIFRIIAIKEIMQQPRKYGFLFREQDLYVMPNFTTIEVDSTIANLSDFAQSHDLNYKLLKQFNPWLRSKSLPDESRRKYILKVPTDIDVMVFDDLQFESDSI